MLNHHCDICQECFQLNYGLNKILFIENNFKATELQLAGLVMEFDF